LALLRAFADSKGYEFRGFMVQYKNKHPEPPELEAEAVEEPVPEVEEPAVEEPVEKPKVSKKKKAAS